MSLGASSAFLRDLRDQITCSISCDVMEDPVRISCPEEHTFDRSMIEAALQLKEVCPLCRGRVKDKVCKPNRELAAIVALYKKSLGALKEPAAPTPSAARMPTPPSISVPYPVIGPSAPPLTLPELHAWFDEKEEKKPPSPSTHLPGAAPSAPPLALSELHAWFDEKEEKKPSSFLKPLPVVDPSAHPLALSTLSPKEEKRAYPKLGPTFLSVKEKKKPEEDKKAALSKDLVAEVKSYPSFDPLLLIDRFERSEGGRFIFTSDREYLKTRLMKKKWGDIHFAAIFGRLDILEQEYKKNNSVVQTRDEEGRNLLMIAAEWGAPINVGEWLLDRDPTLLDQVIEKKNWLVSIFSRSERVPDELKPGSTPLHFAAKSDAPAFFQWLVRKKPALVHARNEDGKIPMHLAGYSIFNEFTEQEELLEPLKDRGGIGTDFSLYDLQSRLPLWENIMSNWSWIAQSLEKKPSSSHREIFKCFLRGKMAVAYMGKDKRYEQEAKWKEVVATLADLLYREDPVLKKMADKGHGHKLEFQFSSEWGHPNWGLPELALLLGRFDIVRDSFQGYKNPYGRRDRFSDAGQSCGHCNKDEKRRGLTLLHVAAWGGHLEAVQWLVEQDSSLLREFHYNHYNGCNKLNALHYAAHFGREKVVRWLIEQDSSLLKKNGEYFKYPSDLAVYNGHLSTAQVLLEHDPSLSGRYIPLHRAKDEIPPDVLSWLISTFDTL